MANQITETRQKRACEPLSDLIFDPTQQILKTRTRTEQISSIWEEYKDRATPTTN
jgi:hypothetical protein